MIIGGGGSEIVDMLAGGQGVEEGMVSQGVPL